MVLSAPNERHGRCRSDPGLFVLIGQPRPIRVPRSIGSHGSTTQSSSRGSRRSATSAHMACVGYGFGVVNRSRIVPSLSGPIRRGTVPAHLFAYQLAHGVIPRLGWSGAEDAVICHQCDFAGATRDVARTYPVSEWNPAAPASRTRWRTVAGASWATKCQMLRPPNSRKIKVNKARCLPLTPRRWSAPAGGFVMSGLRCPRSG